MTALTRRGALAAAAAAIAAFPAVAQAGEQELQELLRRFRETDREWLAALKLDEDLSLRAEARYPTTVPGLMLRNSDTGHVRIMHADDIETFKGTDVFMYGPVKAAEICEKRLALLEDVQRIRKAINDETGFTAANEREVELWDDRCALDDAIMAYPVASIAGLAAKFDHWAKFHLVTTDESELHIAFVVALRQDTERLAAMA